MKRIAFDIGDPALASRGGCVTIGGDSPVAVQTMTNTHTRDIEPTLEQCRRMAAAGAQLIRLTTQGPKEVESLAEIRRRLHAEGIYTPLVADVHFRSDVAMAAARVADKVRINPGNFAQDHEEACARFRELIAVCRQCGTALRIGLNHGSLGQRILSLYGATPAAMKEAVMEWLRMCVEEDFYRVAVSLKASNTRVMVDAYRLLAAAMDEEFGCRFPFHLGITEAGNGDEGRIKSAVGIGTLLREGIGDTVRVSLTEDPVNEIAAGFKIVEAAAMDFDGPVNAADWEEFIIRVAVRYGPDLLDCKTDDCDLEGSVVAGVPVAQAELERVKDILLQACRRRFTRPEYIACPGCGRTMYDLEGTFNEVKRRTAHLSGMRIAVMGCIVNGPGEMADADWGYVGESNGYVSIFRGKEAVARRVPQQEAIDRLLELIEKS